MTSEKKIFSSVKKFVSAASTKSKKLESADLYVNFVWASQQKKSYGVLKNRDKLKYSSGIIVQMYNAYSSFLRTEKTYHITCKKIQVKWNDHCWFPFLFAILGADFVEDWFWIDRFWEKLIFIQKGHHIIFSVYREMINFI